MNKAQELITKINLLEDNDLDSVIKKIMHIVVNVSASDQKPLDKILDEFCARYDSEGTDVKGAIRKAGLKSAEGLLDRLSDIKVD